MKEKQEIDEHDKVIVEEIEEEEQIKETASMKSGTEKKAGKENMYSSF